jgi:hypothetical protein
LIEIFVGSFASLRLCVNFAHADAAPTELADFYFVVLQICRAYGAGEGNQFKIFHSHAPV